MRTRTVEFIFITALLGVIGLTLGSALLLRAAVCMLIMLCLSLFSVFAALITCDLRLQLKNAVVKKGEEAAVEVSLRIKSVLPIGSAAYRSDLGFVFRTGGIPFHTYTETLFTVCPHVGVYDVCAGTVYFTDVFNIFVFRKRAGHNLNGVTVLPAVYDITAPETKTRDGMAGAIRFQDDADAPSGVREWVNGDLLRRVHWKLTFKRFASGLDTPAVRTYDEAARPDTVIIADTNEIDAMPGLAMELRDAVCESALSLCAACTEDGTNVCLMLGETEIRAKGKDDIQSVALALAQKSFDDIYSLDDLAALAMKRVQTTGAAVFVTPRLNARFADIIVRLSGYSGLTVAVAEIKGAACSNEVRARLETGGVAFLAANRPEASEDEE